MENTVDFSKFHIDEAKDEKDVVQFDELDYSKYVKFNGHKYTILFRLISLRLGSRKNCNM